MSRRYSGRASTLRRAPYEPSRALGDDPGRDRRHEEDPDDGGAGHDPPLRERGDRRRRRRRRTTASRTTETGTFHSTSRCSRRYANALSLTSMLPTYSTTCGMNENANMIVAIAPTLASDVVGTRQRPGEHQRQHLLATVRADHVRRDEGHEQQQRRRHADVVAVRDDLDAIDRLVARHVADPDVDDRRDRDDAEQHERGDLLAPRPAQAEGPADRRLVQRQRRRAAAAAWPVVRSVAAVVDRAREAHRCTSRHATRRSRRWCPSEPRTVLDGSLARRAPLPRSLEDSLARTARSRLRPGAIEEHLVERREARRQAVQRQAEVGDDVAQRVEVVVAVDLDLDEPVDDGAAARPRRPG